MRNYSFPATDREQGNAGRPPYTSFYNHNHYPGFVQRRPRYPDGQYGRQPKPNFPMNHTLDRPPGPDPIKPNFIVELLRPTGRQCARVLKKPEIEALISQCNIAAENLAVFDSGPVAASISFRQWVDTLTATISLWESRLRGSHEFSVKVVSNVPVPSDTLELREKLRALFSAHVRSLLDGEALKKWRKKVEEKSSEIAAVSAKLRRKGGVRQMMFHKLVDEKESLMAERDLVSKRVKEFESAIRCFLKYLEGCVAEKEDWDGGEQLVEVFKFKGDYNWEQIHHMILRECRRLEDGLPIYAYRQDILSRILTEQTMVLIGETGSGKSTQLVQFLADSGIAADKSIICTQPRKIAAFSLAHRAREESNGCYEKSVISYPAFSSSQQFGSGVIYMTDNCLLQHYMKDRNLSGISCIIIDEAHERSLNTDLLLALVKNLLNCRLDLRLVIMSATADAKQLSEYFFGCEIFHLMGRNFPVDVQYVPRATEGTTSCGSIASYVHDVVRIAAEVHKTEEGGTVLAFLTSQMEVEWACERLEAPSAVVLPLHGKLSFEEQFRVFQDYPGKRKVIFATNIAETSLTIPGVKYVIDSGMVKESKFEPFTGMNVLRVCWTSQSSAKQRAGRAGRTEPGRCYRLYSECVFESMPPNQEPEIRRVHLGVAVLRILALGITDIKGFDFVDAPNAEAIDMATQNLVQLGAITQNKGIFELTEEGKYIVKLGIEPRLGKLIISCFRFSLLKEGLVLAAVMANASSIFCRVGNDDDKLKADCLKVQFCHCNGDLFTLLSVYKEWESLPESRRNKWCWENSINAKSLRRCADAVKELEGCLKNELSVIVPSYWVWNPYKLLEHDTHLKKSILCSLSENIAMYSGYDDLGYEVALTRQHIQLHPSCSLLTFGQKPRWVVFGEILSITNKYLVCVTAFDIESLSTLEPPPMFDNSKMETRKLQLKLITGFGSALLKRFCGKSRSTLLSLVSRVRSACLDEKIGIEVKVDQNEIQLFASSEDMERVFFTVNDDLKREQRLLRNECMEKCLYHGPGITPFALFGAGAVIKHLELEKRFLTVDVYNSNLDALDDKELVMFLEERTSGVICSTFKATSSGKESDENEKWGRVTFLTPHAAKKAAEISEVDFHGSILRLIPSRTYLGADHKMFSFPAVKAKVYWPRRQSKGIGVVKCDVNDIHFLIDDFSNLVIGGKFVWCDRSKKHADAVVVGGIDKQLSEAEILDVLRMATSRRILDFFLVRGDTVVNPPGGACEEAVMREIFPFMPKRNLHNNCCRVQVFPPEPKDSFMRALVIFDGRLHLEAAKALQQLEGKVLPGCLSWQKIRCQQLFHSSLSCSASVYAVIKNQLDSLVARFKHLRGTECYLDRNSNGFYQVRISTNATKTIAELRKPLEELMVGRKVDHACLTPNVLQHLLSRDGINLKRSIQKDTGTFILLDRHCLNVRIFGTSGNVDRAEERLVQSLLAHHESKQLEVHLRGLGLPPNLMKEIVNQFGPDLQGLKDKVPGAELTLNVRYHIISVHGGRELKQKVEEIIYEVARMSVGSSEKHSDEVTCPICLCAVEDGYNLEVCLHLFCRLCLVEQCESAIKNLDSFPICCTKEDCKAPFLLTDLRSLLSSEKLEELFRASLGSFVAASGGAYRFCPSPDCPSVYRVADSGTAGEPFVCGACHVETCTRCHLEYHSYISCERYREFKEDPDSSLKEWCRGKENVKACPICGYTIEKVEGCNHVECKCGKHICWVCLEFFANSNDCYDHLRSVHMSIQ
ncbi:ATP-dependent RNA helicase DEAH12, chloroplastic-like isoform X1 [Carica papaya]|uniref:ATP-dependent RNA helicase DEAH12, chloroplastic-like isoform X1 n=2 Tax=Carica papaya TaxID=3649 RepID=UPI000B8CF6A6|nr:ATP-dependent RNA helicase DEAH12, chloroplastic-like isoform X1 [Carica papaya]